MLISRFSLLCCGLISLSLHAAPKPDVPWKWWAASVAIHGAGTSADAWSSWRQTESNPILSNRAGQFGTKGVAFKLGAFAAVTGLEYGILRLSHSRKVCKVFITVNGILGGEYGVVAIRNFGSSNRTQ